MLTPLGTFRPTALLAVLLLVAAASASAQTDYSSLRASRMLSVGLGFAGGGSIMVDAPENWKLAPLFAYRGGVDASYPITSVIGASLGLGLDSRGVKVHWWEEKEMWDQRRIDYFSVTPGFTFSSFYLGLNLGFPMGGVKTWHNTPDDVEQQIEMTSDDAKLGVMVEPRVGAVVVLLDEEIGWLGLTIAAGYNLNPISDDAAFLPGTLTQGTIGGETVSAHLGITWQFGIPGTGKK